jgi:uncharacterized protein
VFKEEGMKKTFLISLFVLIFGISTALAGELKVGDKAINFTLKDPKGKEYSLNSPEFAGKVISILYVDPDEKDMNVHVEDALKTAPGLKRDISYKGLGIADCKSAPLKPDMLIRSIVKSKQEKTGAIILMDYDWTLVNLWGLKKHSSNVILLDKNRICRYIYKGKMSAAELAKLISLIKEYQDK